MKFFKTTLKIVLAVAALGLLAFLIYALISKKPGQQTAPPSGAETTA